MVIKADIDREISAAPFIAVQADDTTDVSSVISVRSLSSLDM